MLWLTIKWYLIVSIIILIFHDLSVKDKSKRLLGRDTIDKLMNSSSDTTIRVLTIISCVILIVLYMPIAFIQSLLIFLKSKRRI